MTIAVIVLVAAFIVFVIDAWLHKALVSVGLALLALWFLLGVVKV